MLKLLNDGTVRVWEYPNGHSILAGAGARICVQAMGRSNHRRIEESVVRPHSHGHYLDGVFASVQSHDSQQFEFSFDQPAREEFPWHHRLVMTLIADRGRLSYQVTLSRNSNCTETDPMWVRYGILPYFATCGGAWSVHQGELGRADETNDFPNEGTIFKPGYDLIRLTTVRGRVEIGARSGFDGMYLKAYKSAGTVCLAPIAGYTENIRLEPGESTMAATTITYTPN